MAEAGRARPAVAVIPARGGSKRIPRKNIRPFRGRPLISWTIETVRSSGLFDRVVVSTDDDEVAEVAVEAGAEVPFRRPPELSDDHTGTGPVVVHAIRTLEESAGGPLGAVCLVYPAAVFVLPADLGEAFEALEASAADYVFSAATFAAPVQRALRRAPDGTVEMVWPQHRTARSQDLEELVHDAGQFYWGGSGTWKAGKPVLASRALAHMLPHWRVQDIDTPEDWARAELVHRIMHER